MIKQQPKTMPANQTPAKKRKLKLIKSPKPVPACSVCGATENIITDEDGTTCDGACDENPASRLYEPESEPEEEVDDGSRYCYECGCEFQEDEEKMRESENFTLPEYKGWESQKCPACDINREPDEPTCQHCDNICAKKYIGDKKSEYWGTTGKAGDDRHPYHWNLCEECFKEEEEEEEEYPKKEWDDQGFACWHCRDCGGWNDWQVPCGHCRLAEKSPKVIYENEKVTLISSRAMPDPLSDEESDSESEPDEDEDQWDWEDIKRFIVDEYDRGWVVEYPGGDRQKVLKKQVIGKPRFAQPSVTLSVSGEAEAKQKDMKHPAPAIKCPTMTLKEEAEKKGYKIYFSADKKHKQQYANQQRALGLIRKGKKSWDDYDHDWLSTKQTKARRTIDEVDKLRDEVAELKALVKTLMAKLG